MRIDNYPVLHDREPTPSEVEFCNKRLAIILKSPKMEFQAIVVAYKELEDEFINRPEWEVLETKRRIAEGILRAAHDAEQPFEVCRDAWNALVELGFSSLDTYCNYAWFYADCCLFNAQYDVGIDVLDMAILELQHRLDESSFTRQSEKYYDRELIGLKKLREKIVAYKSSEAEGIAWDEREDAELDAQEARASSPQKSRETKLIGSLEKAIYDVRKTSSNRRFIEMVQEYRKAEADFLTQLESGDDFFVSEVHRQVAAAILEEAQKHREPFEACREAWNELLQWGFKELTDKCALTRTYAECCLLHQQADAGLALVEPLLAEIQKHIAEGTDTEMPRQRYPREIARLTKLRDELNALKQ